MNTKAVGVDQVLTGVRRVLSDPRIYDGLQSLLGVNGARKYVCKNIIDAKDGDSILDIGCGTAELLRYLPPSVKYYGFDLSEPYIAAAKKRYRLRENCSFQCANLDTVSIDDLPYCQHAIAYGVLHHLNDDVAKRTLTGLYERLAPGARVITVDPVFAPEQAVVARELIRRDRGQHVRTADGYANLVPSHYASKKIEVRHDLLRVPYSLAIMVCQKA